MIEMQLNDEDRLDWALRRFKRLVQKAGIMTDLRRKRHYTKPSVARAMKTAAAKRRKRTNSRRERA